MEEDLESTDLRDDLQVAEGKLQGEQDSGGNGGQCPSFASLWPISLSRATLLP
jgi:hypothetical protein